jgi:hypothetical protein
MMIFFFSLFNKVGKAFLNLAGELTTEEAIILTVGYSLIVLGALYAGFIAK